MSRVTASLIGPVVQSNTMKAPSPAVTLRRNRNNKESAKLCALKFNTDNFTLSVLIE